MTQPTPSAQPKTKLPIIEWDQAYNRNSDKSVPREVLNAIRTYVDNQTLRGFVSVQRLMDDTGLCKRAVNKQIRTNKEAGWLELTKRGNSAGAANYYLLTYPERELKFPPQELKCTPTTPLSSQKITTSKERELKFPTADCPSEVGQPEGDLDSDPWGGSESNRRLDDDPWGVSFAPDASESSGGNLDSRKPESPHDDDPFHNPERFLIESALADGSKTVRALSELTGLSQETILDRVRSYMFLFELVVDEDDPFGEAYGVVNLNKKDKGTHGS